jgi:hypothetical protein
MPTKKTARRNLTDRLMTAFSDDEDNAPVAVNGPHVTINDAVVVMNAAAQDVPIGDPSEDEEGELNEPEQPAQPVINHMLQEEDPVAIYTPDTSPVASFNPFWAVSFTMLSPPIDKAIITARINRAKRLISDMEARIEDWLELARTLNDFDSPRPKRIRTVEDDEDDTPDFRGSSADPIEIN